jgi:hypothetical protein
MNLGQVPLVTELSRMIELLGQQEETIVGGAEVHRVPHCTVILLGQSN